MNVLGNGRKIDDANAHFTDVQNKDPLFRRVSTVWTSQCLTYEQGFEKLAEQQAAIHDYKCPLNKWECVVEDGKVALRHRDSGVVYRLTSLALKQIAAMTGCSSWQLNDLSEDKVKVNNKGDEEVVVKRDETDAFLLKNIINHYLLNPIRMDQEKTRLFRVWTSNRTMRAILSEQYCVVNNMWVMEIIKEAIPGGMLSHWRGDADTVFGNVLIPDTIREEFDSAYGGMLSVGNSEVGLRRVMTVPSVFRAICMNGCIWEQKKGDSVRRVHRGAINLNELKHEIMTNLQSQIPLVTIGIDKLLATRQMSVGDVRMGKIFALICKDNSISKKKVPDLVKSFNTELEILGGTDIRTAFGVGSVITRFGQSLTNENWFAMDQVGGQFVNMTGDQWGKLLKRADNLEEKELTKILGDVPTLFAV